MYDSNHLFGQSSGLVYNFFIIPCYCKLVQLEGFFVLNQKLKLVRLASGLSLRQLQERIENRVTAQAIGKYERGESVPSPDVLAVLCRALSIQPDQLLSEQSLIVEGLEFRKSILTSKKDESSIKSQILQSVERHLLIEDELAITNLSWDIPRNAPYPVREIHEAESAAKSVRVDWGLGTDPIQNLTALLEDRGIKVFSIDLPDISGFAAHVKTRSGASIPVMATNKSDWSERKRFTLCHELGHLLMRVVGIDSEKCAHRFAGAFLMPAESLRAELGEHRTSISLGEILEIKKLFGASFQAITYRSKELGIISQSLFSKLFDEYDLKGWRTPPYQEAGAMAPRLEMPSKLNRLCMRGLAEGVLGIPTAASIMGVSEQEITELLLAE